MFGIDARCRIDLEGVDIMSGKLKQVMEGIKHFITEERKILC